MLLKDWLCKNKLKPYRFAAIAKMAPTTIYKALSGNSRLSPRLAVQIETVTQGDVSRAEALWPEAYTEISPAGDEQTTFLPKVDPKKRSKWA